MIEPAILLCGHGSRDAEAHAEFVELVSALRARFPNNPVEFGYLELAQPTIVEALDGLRQRGARKIAAVPIMLLAAAHVRRDIPELLKSYRSVHGDLTIAFGRELGIDSKVSAAAAERIGAAVDASAASETGLVVVGRGASDRRILTEVQDLTEKLRVQMGFSAAATCYCGIAEPGIERGLEEAAALGCKRLVAFPLLLFTGVLVKRVYETVDAMAVRYPEITFRKASYLKNHPAIVDACAARVQELL